MKMSQELFSKGFAPADYVQNLRNYRSVVRGFMETATVEPSHVDRLKAAVSGRPQPVRATIMTEDWCGDSACNLPVLTPFFSGAGVELRVFRGSEHPDLKRFYEESGDEHIPAVSVWDGTGAEIARWIEAPAAIGERKDAWKAERPHFMELYRKQNEGDKDAARQFGPLYRELIDAMGEWYQGGMWAETTREIVEKLEA